jgi:hypothetical protein
MTDSRLSFRLSEEKLGELNWAAQIAYKQLARGEAADLEDVRELMATFVTNTEDKFLEIGEARRLLGRLMTDQVADAVAKFSKAMNDWAVPKASGKHSQPESTDMGPPLDGSVTS